jgi:integrase
MASVVDKQLSDGSKAYLVRFRTADGKQRSKQFKRRRDALAFANVTEVDRQHGTLVDPRLGRITVGEWWDQWWPTVTNLRPSTKARDEQFFRTHARPVFGSTPLGKLDRTALRAWVADLGSPDGSNLAPATIHRVVQLMNKCVNAAFEDRLIAHNPVAKLPLPRIERREMRFLDTDNIWKLADEIDEAYRSFVLLGAFGGLRLGEMLGLRWKRVDLLRRRVDIAETLVSIGGHITFGPPKTKAAVRTVPLPSFVCWIDTDISTRSRTTN